MASIVRNPFVRYGVPFFLLVVGGSFALREFVDLRYRYKTSTMYLTRQEAKKYGIEMRKPEEITLEKEYERMMRETDLDNWENKRVPRPWVEEESTDNK